MKGGNKVNIREKREQLGMSQKKLDEKCGIAQSTLCDIDQGRSNQSLPVAVKIAQVLNKNSIQFFADN